MNRSSVRRNAGREPAWVRVPGEVKLLVLSVVIVSVVGLTFLGLGPL